VKRHILRIERSLIFYNVLEDSKKNLKIWWNPFIHLVKGKICEDIKNKYPKIDHSLSISIMGYPRLVFTKEDLSKRKRVKDAVATTNRCAARTADGQQCSRHKRETPSRIHFTDQVYIQ